MATQPFPPGASTSGAIADFCDNVGDTDVHITDEQYLAGARRSILESIQALEKHARRVVDAVRTLGNNLAEAKKRVPYGNWETWIRVNTPLSTRTAQLYMKLATWLEGLPPEEAQRIAVLSLNHAVKAMSVAACAEPALELSPVDHESPPANDEDVSDATELRKRALETFSTTRAELSHAFDEMSSDHAMIPSRLHNLKQSLARSLETVREIQRSSKAEKQGLAAA